MKVPKSGLLGINTAAVAVALNAKSVMAWPHDAPSAAAAAAVDLT